LRFRTRSSWIFVAAVAVMALSFSGCSSSTEPTLTLDDLIAQLQIQLAATGTGGSGAVAGTAAERGATAGQDPRFTTPPTDSQIRVLGPNTNIFTPLWPIIEDIPILGRWDDEWMTLWWPYIDDGRWPDLEVAGGVRFGNTWVVYPAGGDPNNWVAQHSEWIRSPHERTGTTFPLIEKMLADHPCSDCPLGQLIAGPSRHTPDEPQYRRRTVIQWFRWGDMSPWVWDDEATPPGPGPTETPVLTEVHVYITGLSTVLAGGTQIDFPSEVGDVDLMTLDGQVRKVVDSEVPRGTFEHIRFTTDPSRDYVIYGGERKALVRAEPNITVVGPFTVGDGPITMVTLEFDVMASVSENADGSWTLTPQVTIIVTTG